MVESDYKNIIPKNIVFYRKALKLTQAELAEKLKYSDKAISKWERGEAVPDIVVLNQMAALFGINLDTLCSEHPLGKTKASFQLVKRHLHLIISLLSAGLVWLVATVLYVFGSMIWPNFSYFWMAFVYAIPCTAIVLIIFNAIWGKRLISLFLISTLVWTTVLCFYLSIPLSNSFLFFIIAVPLQVLVLLWFLMLYIKGKSKLVNKSTNRSTINDN